MKQVQQRTLDSFRRVQDFLDGSAERVGAINVSAGRKELDDVVANITALVTTQGTANLTLAGQINRERALAVDLKTRHMRPIMVFARARLRGTPDIAALTKPIAGVRPRGLVRAARAMAAAAAPYTNVLEQAGFPGETVQELADAATQVDTLFIERANTRVGRVEATKGIADELTRGNEAIGMLSAVISRQFAGDESFLAAWRAARRVTSKTGGSRGQAAAPESSASVPPSEAHLTLAKEESGFAQHSVG